MCRPLRIFFTTEEWPSPMSACVKFGDVLLRYGSKCACMAKSSSSIKVPDLLNQHCICYCWASTGFLNMILLLHFAIALFSRSGGKRASKHYNLNTDLSLSLSLSLCVCVCIKVYKYTFVGLQGWYLNTGCFKDRFNCIILTQCSSHLYIQSSFEVQYCSRMPWIFLQQLHN